MTLQNKTVLFLGSSVTYGSAAGGVSFADLMAEKLGLTMVKEAVSGTTLVDTDATSYVARLKAIDPTASVDFFLCQLSTNDATRGFAMAEIEGAIREILAYVRDTFGCPMAFYTGTWYDSPRYGEMVALLKNLQGEYDFHILNLWEDEEMRAVSAADYARYMADPIHPNLTGYTEWWLPKFEAFFAAL